MTGRKKPRAGWSGEGMHPTDGTGRSERSLARGKQSCSPGRGNMVVRPNVRLEGNGGQCRATLATDKWKDAAR